MTNKTPLVSVVIPTYNRTAFVGKAVASVLNQTFDDYEVIVVDDGSTDSTKDNLKKFGDRIRYIHQKNSGVSAARNTGIAAAAGKWIAFLDSDDEWKPDYLLEQIKRVSAVAGLSMQAADCTVIDINGDSETYFEINGATGILKGKNYLCIDKPFSFVVTHGPWIVCSIIFLREAISRAGPFDTSISISEDLDFVARVSLQGGFGLVNKDLVTAYRRRESTECLTNQAKKNPFGARKSTERILEKLKAIPSLDDAERKALNRVMGANKRAMGNLLSQAGDKRGARACYRQALSTDLSVRSLGKYIVSHFQAP